MPPVQARRLRLWQDRIDTEVEVCGEGMPLVYLHGPWGLAPDRPFAARLAAHHTVYAPKFPGTSAGNPNGIHVLESWLDLIVYYCELIEQLDVRSPVLVGHSFGALLAAELAAASPKTFGRLVLIDPLGLWRDDRPVTNWMLLSDEALRPALFADPAGDAARAFFDVPTDAEAGVERLAQFIWAQACTGKFIWPIAERGFENRSHRIGVPTLVVWGQRDAVIAPDYAKDFAAKIAGSKVHYVAHASHLPHLERSEETADAVHAFLKT